MIKEILDWLKTIIIAVVIGLVLTVIVRPILVKGHSMEPTLGDNNYLLIEQVSYQLHEPDRGDIIVFSSTTAGMDGSSRDLIKRVIAAAGDHITIEKGVVYVNDRALNETYLKDKWTDGHVDLDIPSDTVFVMGDNRENSMDSRSKDVGLVHTDQIRGRVLIRLFPIERFGIIE